MLKSRTALRAVLPLIVVLAMALVGCSMASEPVPAGPIQSGPLPGEVPDIPVIEPSMANGASVYFDRCASCHGEDGAGAGAFAEELANQGATLPDLSDPALAYSRSPQSWYQVITNGTVMSGGLMPPWSEALTDAQRWDVAYFLYSLSTPGSELDSGQALFQQYLAECYGAQGELVGLDAFELASTLSPQQIYDDYVLDTVGCPSSAELVADQAWSAAVYALLLPVDKALIMDGAELDLAAAEVEEPAETTTKETPVEEPAEEEQTAETAEEVVEEEPAADEPLTATVQGNLVNGSTGEQLSGIEVTLHGLQLTETNDVDEFLSATGVTDKEGFFQFDQLPLDPNHTVYVIETIYDGLEFANGALVNPEFPVMDLPLMVFETTADESVITLDAMHVIVEEVDGGVVVVQVSVYSNTSESVYLSEKLVGPDNTRASIAMGYAPGATGFTFEEGGFADRFVQDDPYVYDTQAIYPGEQSHNVVMQYFVPGEGRMDIDIPLPYHTAQLTVVSASASEVKSSMLSEGAPQMMGGQSSATYVTTDVAAGETLSFSLRPAASFPWTIVLGALAAVIVAGAAYVTFFRGGSQPAAVQSSDYAGEQISLLQRIAELDDAYEAGKINRIEYEARRAELKSLLAEEL